MGSVHQSNAALDRRLLFTLRNPTTQKFYRSQGEMVESLWRINITLGHLGNGVHPVLAYSFEQCVGEGWWVSYLIWECWCVCVDEPCYLHHDQGCSPAWPQYMCWIGKEVELPSGKVVALGVGGICSLKSSRMKWFYERNTHTCASV